MLSRLKEAYYRHTLGRDQAELITRMEKEVAELRPCEAWAGWFWTLPPDMWEDAIMVGRLELEIIEARESAVRAITHRNMWRERSPDSPQALAAEETMTLVKKAVIDQEATLRETRLSLATHVGKTPALRENLLIKEERF